MVKSERQATESFRNRLCARSIAAPRAALKERYGLLNRQHVKSDVIG